MVETGHNLLMESNAVTKCLIVHIHIGLLAVSFYLLVGAALSLLFKKDLADQPGGVVV